MNRQQVFIRITVIVITIVTVTVVFFSRPGEFRITRAFFAGQITSGYNEASAKPEDLVIYTSGRAKYPLKASFWMVNANQPANYQKAQIEISKPGHPIVLKDFYKFWGFRSPVDVSYNLTLEEKISGGKKTVPYTMQFHVNTP